jgi:hypothetical protein
MPRMRVISVWAVAISAVLIAYRVYNRVSKTPVIEPPDAPSAQSLPNTPFDGPRVGPATVGQAENARYTFIDEQTRQVTRVFGFGKLLNPETGSRKWNLQKPYITMYERTFDCEITADRGAMTVETVKGNPSPTDGQLYENVVISIRGKDSDEPIDSAIYLDELSYNSERSEFSTEGPVRIVSPQVEMEGRGMVLIYNPAGNRIEFFKVFELDYLHLKEVESLSSDSGKSSPAPAPVGEPTVASGADAGARPLPPSMDDMYVCTFSRDVVIAYGGEVRVEGAQEIVINNILWAREERTPKKHSEGPGEAGAVRTDAALSDADVSAEAVTEDGKGPVNVRVTCKGGFMAKPLTSVFESIEPGLSGQHSRSMTALPGTGAQEIVGVLKDGSAEGPGTDAMAGAGAAEYGTVVTAGEAGDEPAVAAQFKARRIAYDMTTGYALAEGPVELTFRPASDTEADPNATVLPMIVTAEKNAEFFANADRVVERIVFNENVIGTRRVLTPEYVETSSFYGRTLTTVLETNKEHERNGQISHVAVTEGNVKLESIRTNEGGDVVSNVRLVCLRIDYDAMKSIVYATGPGNIQLNNQNAPPRATGEGGGKLSLSGPCFALVRGFDRLTWFTEAMQINADGKEESLHIAYWPIEEGRRGQIYRGSTMRLQANFWPLPEGGSELATVITTGGIHYQEDGGNEFLGEDLLYDAEKGLLVITSSEQNACLLNGALVDRIDYEVNTGRVRGSLASSPGAITVPAKP